MNYSSYLDNYCTYCSAYNAHYLYEELFKQQKHLKTIFRFRPKNEYKRVYIITLFIFFAIPLQQQQHMCVCTFNNKSVYTTVEFYMNYMISSVPSTRDRECTSSSFYHIYFLLLTNMILCVQWHVVVLEVSRT